MVLARHTVHPLGLSLKTKAFNYKKNCAPSKNVCLEEIRSLKPPRYAAALQVTAMPTAPSSSAPTPAPTRVRCHHSSLLGYFCTNGRACCVGMVGPTKLCECSVETRSPTASVFASHRTLCHSPSSVFASHAHTSSPHHPRIPKRTLIKLRIFCVSRTNAVLFGQRFDVGHT